MTENKKNSGDITFSSGAIESKRKRRIERISRDGKFMKKERVQNYFLCFETRYEIA